MSMRLPNFSWAFSRVAKAAESSLSLACIVANASQSCTLSGPFSIASFKIATACVPFP